MSARNNLGAITLSTTMNATHLATPDCIQHEDELE